MQYIDKNLIENLYLDAQENSRKRSHLLLHKSHQEKVQRLLIGLIKGSYVEPHFHELPHQWEMFFVLEGSLELRFHNSKGEILNSTLIGEGSLIRAVEIQPNEVHSLVCLSSNALILEIKEGPFDANISKKLLDN